MVFLCSSVCMMLWLPADST